MDRTIRHFRIPDIIIRKGGQFTQIPNDMLRDANLSAKAKGILCLLLTNNDGWYSYLPTILSMMKDGRDSIQSGLKELEDTGYLVRVKYRDKQTKKVRGSLWVYADVVGECKVDEHWLKFLDERGLEFVELPGTVHNRDSRAWKPRAGFPVTGNPPLSILSKNTKKLDEKEEEVGEPMQSGMLLPQELEPPITPSLFEEFWSLYPRKVDKGAAKTAWEKLCRKKERPTWKQIQEAIHGQKKSERWQDPKYIPHPTTWLNQQRWLDDPAEMKSHSTPDLNQPAGGKPKPSLDADKFVRQSLGHLAKFFQDHCVNLAVQVMDEPKEALVTPLVNLYEAILRTQQTHLSAELAYTLPGPISVIEEYLEWLDNQDWINDKTAKMLTLNHRLFQRFCLERAKHNLNNRHPLTGKHC